MKTVIMKKYLPALLLALVSTTFAKEKLQIEHSKLKGSKIMIIKPEKWNKKVLILAHGYRPKHCPLTAEFSYNTSGFLKKLFTDGWMVASTSYRKNGWAVKEGIEDIGILSNHITKKYGPPKKVYLSGTSMGGQIVVLIAENSEREYAGILCNCPAIGEKVKLTYNPRIQIVFLCNQNEQETAKRYLNKLTKNAVVPAFRKVNRDGHCNINDAEEAAAFNDLLAYSEGKTISMDSDCTVKMKPKSTAEFKNGKAYGKVFKISPAHGSFTTKFTKGDLNKLGIKKGDSFIIGFGKNKHKIFWGTSYWSATKGDFVCFITAEGYVLVSYLLDRAAKLLGCKKGDRVFVYPVLPEGKNL